MTAGDSEMQRMIEFLAAIDKQLDRFSTTIERMADRMDLVLAHLCEKASGRGMVDAKVHFLIVASLVVLLLGQEFGVEPVLKLLGMK
jgi:hypothetical protein